MYRPLGSRSPGERSRRARSDRATSGGVLRGTTHQRFYAQRGVGDLGGRQPYLRVVWRVGLVLGGQLIGAGRRRYDDHAAHSKADKLSRVVARSSIGKMTYAEYVALEEKGEAKHEFIRGDVFAMAGGTPAHAALAMAIGRQIGNALDGKPCRVFSSDLRIRVKATDFAAYPDVTVIRGKLETDPEDPDAATNPKVIVDVLSDATEAYDRGAKAAQYRRIPSLEEYVLVAQAPPMIEVYRRNERGKWELAVEAGRGQTANIASISVTIDVDTAYANPLG